MNRAIETSAAVKYRPGASRRRLLLVEDNADDEELAIVALKSGQLDCAIDVVRDGQEALDYLFGTGKYASRVNAELPLVVFLDLMLPKLNGHDVLQRIRKNERTKRLPVVILTSSGEESDIVRVYEHHANSYVRKPVAFDSFREVVRTLGVYWAMYNEVPHLEHHSG